MRGGVPITRLHAFLDDKAAPAGGLSQYLTQDLWAAKKIFELDRDEKHYDVGSRIDGFITHLLCFGKSVVMIDVRPFPHKIDERLEFVQADATNLESIQDDSLYSLSALCSLEHFGLGRYGDPIDPEACDKAICAIQRVMKPGGKVYISLPIGQDEIWFNNGRIFKPQSVVELFTDMRLIEFSIATPNGEPPLIKNVNPKDNDNLNSPSDSCFVGLFEFEKRDKRFKV